MAAAGTREDGNGATSEEPQPLVALGKDHAMPQERGSVSLVV